MRVLLVNYRYFVSGGPERYMFAVTDMLERAGHDVIPFSTRYARNRETSWSEYFVEPIAGDDEVYYRDHSRSVRSLTRGLQRAFYAPDAYDNLRRLVAEATPDVALIQHYLRKLSPSVLVALKDAGIPIVVRLSDYAMVCAEAHLLRDGNTCRRCVTGQPFSCIRYRCVQGSFAVSAVACMSMYYAKWRKYFDLIDYFLAPSSVMRDEMIAGGYDASRIVVLPTFVDASRFDANQARCRRIVYVGRLSPEKGLDVLVDAYEKVLRHDGLSDVELIVAGDGESSYVEGLTAHAQRISPQAKFIGEVDADTVRALLSTSLVSVVPSLCYENQPNVMLESLAAGTPIAASDLGSMAEVLRGTGAGFLFRPGNSEDLARGLVSLLRDPETLRRMSASARNLAESRYSPEAHLSGLLGVLLRAIRRGDRAGVI